MFARTEAAKMKNGFKREACGPLKICLMLPWTLAPTGHCEGAAGWGLGAP